MEFGVLYLPSGWHRECANEAQGDGETAVLIINGKEADSRDPDES